MRYRMVVVGLALVAAAGCQEQTDVTRDGAAADEAVVDTPATDPAGDVMMVRIDAVGGSGISGDAAAHHMDDSVRIGLSLSGLQSGTSYAAHIHSGTCAAGGPVRVALQSVTGGADGMGTSSTSVAADQLGADESSFIQVHLPGGQPAACGDIEGHGPASN